MKWFWLLKEKLGNMLYVHLILLLNFFSNIGVSFYLIATDQYLREAFILLGLNSFGIGFIVAYLLCIAAATRGRFRGW